MNFINYDDALRQLELAGIIIDPTKLSVDGRIQRWKTADSKGGEKPGWSRLKPWQSKAGHYYIVGCFGTWQGNDDGYTKVELPKRDDPDRPVLSDEDIAAARAAQKAAAQAIAEERKREAKTAAGWAAQVWSKCSPAGEHDYLTRKGIGPNGTRVFGGMDDLRLPGIDDANLWRLQKSVGALVVPMHDTNGNICGLQFIFAKGHEFEGKQFWPTGMAMGGTFGVIGGLRRSGVMLLTEGFATAASLHEATGQPVAYAFSANNLGKAGKQIRAKYKQLRILFCADDDYITEKKNGNNPGVDAAMLAASEIELAAWTKPDFSDEAGIDRRDGKKLSDYNDLAVLTGLPLVVANQINAKLDALKWRDAAQVAAGSNDKGGGEAGGRRRAEAVMALDDIVARFIPIDDGSGKYVWDTWTRKIVQREQMITVLPAGVRGDDIKRHPAWIERGAYYLNEIGFDPTGKDADVRLNSWCGWPTVPKKGGCDRLLELLRYQCGKEQAIADELYSWVLRWLAYLVQHPGAKMQTAIIMHGPQGTGKGRFFEWGYMPIFGRYGVYLDQDALEDKHGSDWQSCKLFVLADEVLARAEMYHHKNKLKNLVTSRRIRINPKGTVAFEETNHLNIVFLSNEKQPLVLENDDRRYCVIWTPPPLGREFYDELSAEIANGGVEALHWHLKHEVDLGDFKPWTPPPVTEAKRDLINMSRDSVDRFLIDWQHGDTDLPFCPCSSADLYRAYLGWCRTNGERMPRPENQFSGHIVKLHGWFKGHKDINMEDENGDVRARRQRVVIPSDAALNEAAKRGGEDYRQGAAPLGKWLTTCFFTFRRTMKVEA